MRWRWGCRPSLLRGSRTRTTSRAGHNGREEAMQAQSKAWGRESATHRRASVLRGRLGQRVCAGVGAESGWGGGRRGATTLVAEGTEWDGLTAEYRILSNPRSRFVAVGCAFSWPLTSNGLTRIITRPHSVRLVPPHGTCLGAPRFLSLPRGWSPPPPLLR